jgi:hypothetical protein
MGAVRCMIRLQCVSDFIFFLSRSHIVADGERSFTWHCSQRYSMSCANMLHVLFIPLPPNIVHDGTVVPIHSTCTIHSCSFSSSMHPTATAALFQWIGTVGRTADTDPNTGHSEPNSALSELQAQLQETQVSLASTSTRSAPWTTCLLSMKSLKAK